MNISRKLVLLSDSLVLKEKEDCHCLSHSEIDDTKWYGPWYRRGKKGKIRWVNKLPLSALPKILFCSVEKQDRRDSMWDSVKKIMMISA